MDSSLFASSSNCTEADPWKRSASIDSSEQLCSSMPSLGLFCPRCVAREHCAFHSYTGLEIVNQEEGRRRGGALLNLLQLQPSTSHSFFDGPPGTFDNAAVVCNADPLGCGTAHYSGVVAIDDASTGSGSSEAAFSIESDGSPAERHHSATQGRLLQELAWQQQYWDSQQPAQHQQLQQQQEQHWFGAASEERFSPSGFVQSYAQPDVPKASFSQTAQPWVYDNQFRSANARWNTCEAPQE